MYENYPKNPVKTNLNEMISAKLIKDLERYGFKLDFPSYDSNENKIIDTLKTDNRRLYLAIPLLLQHKFDYKRIIKKLTTRKKSLIGNFDKIIIITNKIFKLEGIDNSYIKRIINKYKIKSKIRQEEFQYYYDSFKESVRNLEGAKEKLLEEQIKMRSTLNTNKALSKIFAPGKLRIMDKIFNHKSLTNTELKYYYRSIRPLILSILNEALQKYIRIIESTKKYSLKN